jgi:hypothetical protein
MNATHNETKKPTDPKTAPIIVAFDFEPETGISTKHRAWPVEDAIPLNTSQRKSPSKVPCTHLASQTIDSEFPGANLQAKAGMTYSFIIPRDFDVKSCAHWENNEPLTKKGKRLELSKKKQQHARYEKNQSPQ